MPERIQRKRSRGWRMPENAVYVGRPSLFGNPWSLEDAEIRSVTGDRRQWCVDAFRREIEHWGLLADFDAVAPKKAAVLRELELPTFKDLIRRELRGKALACWCPLDQPCHADVLLEWANA